MCICIHNTSYTPHLCTTRTHISQFEGDTEITETERREGKEEGGKVRLTVSFFDYSFSLLVFLFSPLLVFVLTFFPAVLNTRRKPYAYRDG